MRLSEHLRGQKQGPKQPRDSRAHRTDRARGKFPRVELQDQQEILVLLCRRQVGAAVILAAYGIDPAQLARRGRGMWALKYNPPLPAGCGDHSSVFTSARTGT